MTIAVTPIPRLIDLTAPAFTLGLANTAGSAITAVASDSTLLAFDTTLPDAITFGQSGAVGSATVATRRDHSHAMVADPANLILIATIDADDSSDLTLSGMDGTYDVYMVALSNIMPAGDGSEAMFRVGDSGGIDSGGSDYAYHTMTVTASSTSYAAAVSTGASGIRLGHDGIGNANGEGLSAALWVYRPTDTSTYPTVSGTHSFKSPAGTLSGGTVVGQRLAAITMTQVQYDGTVNIATGRMTLYGLSHS